MLDEAMAGRERKQVYGVSDTDLARFYRWVEDNPIKAPRGYQLDAWGRAGASYLFADFTLMSNPHEGLEYVYAITPDDGFALHSKRKVAR